MDEGHDGIGKKDSGHPGRTCKGAGRDQGRTKKIAMLKGFLSSLGVSRWFE